MRPPDISPERLAAVEVDPDLVLAVIEEIAASDRRPSRRRRQPHDLFVLCAAAYAEHVGVDAQPGVDAFEEHDLQVIAALLTRMTALSELMEKGHLKPGGSTPEAVAEAASSARLAKVGDRTGFQLLDFLARLERAKAEPTRW